MYVFGRSQSKFDDCVARLSAPIPKKPLFIQCDLASISSSESAAKQLLSLESCVHILFCSAGIAWTPSGTMSEDGYELTFHSNVMGHFILFAALRPALSRAYDETGKKGRVVWTSSYGLNTAPSGGVVFEGLKKNDKGSVGGTMGRQPLYGQVCPLWRKYESRLM